MPSAVTKYAGYAVTLPSPSQLTKNGFVFVGWSDGEKTWHPGDVYVLGAAVVSLRAVWEEKVWTLEEAAGLTGLTLTTGGDAVWTVDLTTNYDGVASIRSGQIGDSQTTWVSMTVTGPGTISFRTLVSGEYYCGKLCDYLKFEVDGAETFASYDANWSNVVVEVSGKGAHTLKWTYLKNASKSAGDDCAWLDEIVWTANEEPEESLPDLGDTPSAADVTNAVAGATDPQVKAKVDAANYNDFRDWAGRSRRRAGATRGAGRDGGGNRVDLVCAGAGDAADGGSGGQGLVGRVVRVGGRGG